MGELNENEPKSAYKNIFSKIYYGLYDFTDGKEWKTFALWAGGLFIVAKFILFCIGLYTDNTYQEEINKLKFTYKSYRGVIKDTKGNIITTASCTLNYSDPTGKPLSEPQKNDTINMTGYYLFKIPMNSKEMILNVSKNPSDKKGFPQTLDENETDILKTIIYP